MSQPFLIMPMSLKLLKSKRSECNKLISIQLVDETDNYGNDKITMIIVYRNCDVSYNCYDPVRQSECSVLTLMRNSAFFHIFIRQN